MMRFKSKLPARVSKFRKFNWDGQDAIETQWMHNIDKMYENYRDTQLVQYRNEIAALPIDYKTLKVTIKADIAAMKNRE